MKLMLLGLSFIVFHINKMNFFSINFSPLKKLIFKEKRIWSWWWLWVPSHIEDYVYLGLFFEVLELIFSTNFCFPNPFAFINVQFFVSLIFYYRTSVQIVLQICCFWCYCAWGSKSSNGDDSISGVGGGILRWVAESVLLVLRNRF